MSKRLTIIDKDYTQGWKNLVCGIIKAKLRQPSR